MSEYLTILDSFLERDFLTSLDIEIFGETFLLYCASVDGSVTMSMCDVNGSASSVCMEIVKCDLPVYCLKSFHVGDFIFLAFGGMEKVVHVHVQNQNYETLSLFDIPLKSPAMSIVLLMEETTKSDSEGQLKCIIYAGCQNGIIYQYTYYINIAGGEFNYAMSSSRTLIGHRSDIRDLKHYNNHLISSSDDSTIRIWDFDTYECIKCLENHSNSVSSIETNGNILLSCGKDRVIYKWDLTGPLKEPILSFDSKAPKLVKLNNDDSFFIAGAEGSLTLQSLTDPSLTTIIPLHTASINSIVTLSPFTIATISNDSHLKITKLL